MNAWKNIFNIHAKLPASLGFALGLAASGAAAELPAFTASGYAVPQPGRQFIFPRDHGSHPEFAIEWWYVTGHLAATNRQEFGFQATFFRRALMPVGTTNRSDSAAFGNDQIYLAHMALVDKTAGTFRHQERLNRAGWDAAAATNTLAVRNGNWSLRFATPTTDGREILSLQASVGADATFQLTLSPKKPLVIFGTNGVSHKAVEPEAASHYLTWPRLTASGTVALGETNWRVTGEAWMDHEFSSSQLGAGQTGWDWLSLQLFDGRELMAYRMRRSDDSTDPFSTVAWIDRQSVVRQIGPEQFQWTTAQRWHSRPTGANYPSLVKLAAMNPFTSKTETFIVQPVVADQELNGKTGGMAYWEGACRVLDENQKEIGRAYMELTGYGASLKGKF